MTKHSRIPLPHERTLADLRADPNEPAPADDFLQWPRDAEGSRKTLDGMTDDEYAGLRDRCHNQWTRAKMRRFLEALADLGSVKDAAAAVGMSRQSAYNLRNRLKGQPFDMAWETALEMRLQNLADAALDRALNGVEEPIFHQGEQVGTRTRFNERLTIFLLANPQRVGRLPKRREYASEGWSDVLQAIQHGPLTREDAEREKEERRAAMTEVEQADDVAAEAALDEKFDADFQRFLSHSFYARIEQETGLARQAAAGRDPKPWNHGTPGYTTPLWARR